MYTQKQLDEMVHKLKKLKRDAEDLATEISNIENALKEEMNERCEYNLSGDDWKITWNMVSSNRFNQSNFKSAHPDLYEQFKTLSESRRFVVN